MRRERTVHRAIPGEARTLCGRPFLGEPAYYLDDRRERTIPLCRACYRSRRSLLGLLFAWAGPHGKRA